MPAKNSGSDGQEKRITNPDERNDSEVGSGK